MAKRGHFISTETARVRQLRYFLSSDQIRTPAPSASDVIAETLSLPNGFLEEAEYLRGLKQMERRFGTDRLGYDLSKHYNLAMSGSLGFLIGAQPDGKAVLDVLTKFSSHFCSSDHLSSMQLDDMVILKYMSQSTQPDQTVTFEMKSMQVLRALCQLLGHDMIKNVRFGWNDPAYVDDLDREFPFQMRYEPGPTIYYLDPECLDMPVGSANPMLATAITSLISHQNMLPRDRDIEDQLLDLLFEGPTATLKSTAAQLAVSVRTLQRKLSERGKTFIELKEEVLREQAIVLLLCSDLSILDISLALGFSELSSFYRAFRQWTDETPANFRKNHSGDLPELS